MASTSSRTLRLLSLLQTRRYWAGAELAERLSVSPRTLRRDIDRLRELGYPVQAQRGVEGGYQLAAGAALPPLVVDEEEAVALAVGLQAAAQGATVQGVADASVRALAKVVQVMPSRLRRRVEAVAAMTVPVGWGEQAAVHVDPDVLTAVTLACRDAERLRFSYTAADGRSSDRHVEPYRVVAGRHWYLVGYDLERHDWRSFRLDRLAGPSGTGERFRPRELPAEDAAAFVRASISELRGVHKVEVLVDAPAEDVHARIGRWTTVEDAGAGRSRVLMTVETLDWAVGALVAVNAEFDVISPPELSDYVRECGHRFVRATTSSRGG